MTAATRGTTADERVRADDVAVRKGPLTRKSRFKTFWAHPGPEGEAAMVERPMLRQGERESGEMVGGRGCAGVCERV